MQDEVRQLLRDKATEMPPHLDVPPSLQKRVRPRIARNAALMAATAAVVTVVAVAGFRSLNGPPISQSVGDTPTQTGAGSSTCQPYELRVTMPPFEGAAGSRDGTIALENASGGSCTLSGTPIVTFTDSDLRVIADVNVVDGAPGWQAQGAPEPDGWPVVTLASGGVASVRIGWSNWCKDLPLLRLTDAGGNQIAMLSPDAGSVPPCNGAGQPSTVEVGPYEPSS